MDTPPTPADRDVLVAVLADRLNTWMPGIGHGAHQVASAIARGLLPERIAVAFTPYDPGSCASLRTLLNLEGTDDTGDENLSLAMMSLTELVQARVQVDDGCWYLDAHMDAHLTSAPELNARLALEHLTYRKAARLFLEASDYLSVGRR